MAKLADRFHCTGCSACVNVCVHQAIIMQADDEGFLQPKIEEGKCVKCGMCTKKCPELFPIKRVETSPEAYAMISYEDRNISSSGGAFSVFSRWILKEGGVVFGAAIDGEFKVQHIAVEKISDLSKLRGSKYVQSNMGDCYKQVRKQLLMNRKVLFTGTPCQVAGLYAFLGRRYEDLLITLDLICHGVPSQQIFDTYLEKIRRLHHFKGLKMEKVCFRKLNSWSIVPAIKFEKTKFRILTLSENVYMNAFFKGIIFRESCFSCQYCNIQRVGTFTIGDFWGIGRHGKYFSKNIACGVSLVIDNEGKMGKLSSILDKYAYIEKRSMEEAVAEQHNLREPMLRLPQRNFAIKMFLDKKVTLIDISQACGLPWKRNYNYLIVKTIKNIVYFFGLYNLYKTFIYKLGK